MSNRKHRSQPAGEGGFTVLELSVAMGILSIVLAVFFSAVASVQGSVNKATDRGISNDQVRLAVQQLDREIRSGNILYDPATETESLPNFIQRGYTLRIYTQTNAVYKCVQWRLAGTRLETRSWAPADPAGTVSTWRIVADNVVNKTLATPVPAFSLDPAPAFAGRVVKVTLVTQKSARSGAPVTVESSISGRNTQSTFVGSRCDVVPAY